MEVKHLQMLGLEIFKNPQKVNHVYMEDLFHRMQQLTHRPHKMLLKKQIMVIRV